MLLFSWKIAGADRVELSLPGPEIKVTLGKEQVQAVVNSVSSAFRDSGHYRAKFSYAASFFAGTNRAGTIYFCGNLILIKGKQYRDSTDQFRLLAQKPLEKAYSAHLDQTIDETK